MSEYKTVEELATEVREHFDSKFARHRCAAVRRRSKASPRPGDGGWHGGGFAKCWGDRFVSDERVQGFLGDVSAGRRVGVEMKATITSATAPALARRAGWSTQVVMPLMSDRNAG